MSHNSLVYWKRTNPLPQFFTLKFELLGEKELLGNTLLGLVLVACI